MGADSWYFTRNGKKVGPLPFDAMVAELKQSSTWRDDLIWRPGMADWTAARAVPEVTSDPNPSAAPPPLPASVTPPKRSTTKIVLWVIAAPFLAFAAFAALLEISEAMSDTQTYARSVGLSVSECRQTAMQFGEGYDAADSRCRRRQPKMR